MVEPPDAFTGRFAAKFADAAPRVVTTDDGGEAWLWNGELLPNVGFNAVAGRPSSEYGFEPTRFDEMRRGAWDVDARATDMDINGVDRSLCFPSFLPGFVGQRLTTWPKDPELGLAAMRAYNDWHLEAWCGAHPDRFIPNQITWLPDVELAAEEIRRNAARGFRALTFSEAPEKLGLPSLHTGYWDPMIAACEETETVVCLHVGSSGTSPMTAPDAPPRRWRCCSSAYGMYAAVDWLYSKVPGALPRAQDLPVGRRHRLGGGAARPARPLLQVPTRLSAGTWRGVDMTPADVLRRNFWFCAIDDASGFLTRDVIGVDHILVESDYPHADSTWPDTQPASCRATRDGWSRRRRGRSNVLEERHGAVPAAVTAAPTEPTLPTMPTAPTISSVVAAYRALGRMQSPSWRRRASSY